MEVIFGGRQTGRTTKLIELAAEAEANGEVCYIVCHNRGEAYRIAQMAQRMDKPIGFPITYDEFMNRNYDTRNISHVYIDNAEFLLRRLSSIPIRAITIEEK